MTDYVRNLDTRQVEFHQPAVFGAIDIGRGLPRRGSSAKKVGQLLLCLLIDSTLTRGSAQMLDAAGDKKKQVSLKKPASPALNFNRP